jgi:hypothetical protein
MIRPAGRGEGVMWTEAHRARHDARLKGMVSACGHWPQRRLSRPP